MNAKLRVEIAERQRAVDKAQQAEQALRSSRALWARELHDDLAQALTSLRLDVSWLTGRALTAPFVWREQLTSIAAAIDTLHQTVRLGRRR